MGVVPASVQGPTMQSAAHCVLDNTSAKASTTMSRPLDNTVSLRVHHSISVEGLYGTNVSERDWREGFKTGFHSRARLSTPAHLLRREKRRYLMTQTGRGIVA